MRLRSVELRNFRNHTHTLLDCADGHNILVGKNGEGKTNVLEAISYLCLGRSFFGANDGVVTQHGTQVFTVAGQIEADHGVVYKVDVLYDGEQGTRKLNVGGAGLERRADLIGMFPVVILSPEYAPVTNGGPAERRRMVDTTLAQAQRAYLEDVIEYRKALRQRNKVLLDAKITQRFDEGALLPWTDVLVQRGARITDRRAEFVREFEPFVVSAVGKLTDTIESPTITYQPSIGSGVETKGPATEDRFHEHLRMVRYDEMRSGTTLVGPHRDEFELEINGFSVRQFASQGQHKTFLVGLKFAEYQFLKSVCEETPIMLLDDVLSELDPARNTHVFDLTQNAGQTFITAADPRLLPEGPTVKSRVYDVQGGTVRMRTHADA